MQVREKFIKTMKRQSNEYIPRGIALCPAQLSKFKSVYGHSDYHTEWNLPTRTRSLPFVNNSRDFSKWHENISEKTRWDEWGIGYESLDNGLHFEKLIHPLKCAKSIDELKGYPFPSPCSEKDTESTKDFIYETKKIGFTSIMNVKPAGGTVFWPAYKLRGMENLLCDLYLNTNMAAYLLDKITEICVEQAEIAASLGPDIVFLADDFGTQQSTYVSPEVFRRWFKPRLKKIISRIKDTNSDILVLFHSDGAIQSFIPDFIDIGIDILNPIQPECMDPLEIKREYGKYLSFNGCIGTQELLPFSTAREIKDKVHMYCEEMGKDGGFWVAPTHLVEPEVPWENIIAFIEATEEYGELQDN